MADPVIDPIEEIEIEPTVDLSGLSKEEAVKELAKARREAAERRVKLRDYERKDAERTETERKSAEADSIKRGEHEKVIAEKDAQIIAKDRASKEKDRAFRDAMIEREIKSLLADAIYPDVCKKLIDKKMLTLDADTYEITGGQAAVALLREAHPLLFTDGKRTGTNVAGRGATPGGSKVSSNLMDQEGTLESLIGQYR